MKERRINAGTVIGVVALVFALAGSAVALPGKNKVDANDLKKNSVKTKAIKAGAVTGAKLKANAVTGATIADGAVELGDISAAAASELEPASASGLVDTDGDLSRAENVASVTRDSEGVYCVTPGPGVDPATALMTVTGDGGNNDTNIGNVSVAIYEWNTVSPACEAGQFEVNTFLYDGDGTDDNAGGDDVSLNDAGFAFSIE